MVAGSNSAGGIDLTYSVINCGTKDIKKYTIMFVPYNGADEPLIDQFGKCEAVTSDFDLLPAGKLRNTGSAAPWWYTTQMRYIRVGGIEVTYTDGTTESCVGNYNPTENEADIVNKALTGDRRNNALGAIALIMILFVLVEICWVLSNL